MRSSSLCGASTPVTRAPLAPGPVIAGITVAVEVLDVSDSTVKREWQMAKAWLQVQMQG